MATGYSTARASERLESFIQEQFGRRTLHVPEGEFVHWIPRILYSMDLDDLSLPFMKLVTFPIGGTSIGSLTSVETLDLSGNNITRLSSSMGNCKLLQKLSISFNCLSEFPQLLQNMTNLTYLNISENDITSLDPIIGHLTNLKALHAGGNMINDIPDELALCAELEELDLSGKWHPRGGFKTIPLAICKLPKLVHLNLSWHVIERIPNGIGSLIELETLDLRGNMLRHVSTKISECIKLNKLLLTGAMKLIPLVPAPFLKLRHLTYLDISDNNFTEIPADVSNLEHLAIFIMQRNALLTIPESLFLLPNLQQLDLSLNYINVIPKEIAKAQSLRSLQISRNGIKYIPNEIVFCKKLQTIVADYNEIVDIPSKLHKLKSLNHLDLSFNQLKHLPLLISQLTGLEKTRHLYLYGNKLVKPPQEIADQGVINLFNFLNELRISQAIHRRKLILVGAVKAGKTSLRNALVTGQSKLTAEHERTWVMERHLWEPDDNCRIQIYDFGGHQIYSAAHHMFLTSDAFHLVVIDLSIYTDERYDELVGDWIETIMVRAPGASILLVGTHKDLCTPDEVRHKIDAILKRMTSDDTAKRDMLRTELDNWQKILEMPEAKNTLNEKFASLEVEGIRDKARQLRHMLETLIQLPSNIFVVSCAPDLGGIEDFKSALIVEMKAIGEKPLPLSWQQFLLALCKHPDNLLTWEMASDIFKNIAGDRNTMSVVSITDHLESALKYLHSTGEIVWFHNNKQLQNLIFNRPETLIEMLRVIFRHDFDNAVIYNTSLGNKVDLTENKFQMYKKEFLQHGLMSFELLHFCLLSFGLSTYALETFIALMLKFDLCYEVPKSLSSPKLPSSKQILNFPWFLPSNPPTSLLSEWPEECPSNTVELRMVVTFAQKGPLNFFEKLSVRMQRHVFDRNDWKYGIFAHKNRSKLLVKKGRENCHDKVIFSVRGIDLQELWSLVINSRDEIDELLKEWPSSRFDFSLVCSHCIISRQPHPCIYPGDVLSAKCPSGVYTLKCCERNPDHVIPACFVYSLDPDFQDDIDKHIKVVSEFLQSTQVNDKSGLLTDMGFSLIASQLGHEWAQVVIYLGLQMAQIEQLTERYPHDPVRRIIAALIIWRDSQGDATDGTDRAVDQLLESLTQADRRDLVDQLVDRYHVADTNAS